MTASRVVCVCLCACALVACTGQPPDAASQTKPKPFAPQIQAVSALGSPLDVPSEVVNIIDASKIGTLSRVEATTREHRFIVDGVLSLDARLGSSHVSPEGGKLYVAARIKADRTAANHQSSTPAHLALVIDRSKSMADNQSLTKAKLAAEWLINDLRPQDFLSIIAYDDQADVIWPATPATDDNRAAAIASLRHLGLGDMTCISCALDTATSQVLTLASRPDAPPNLVQRLILLSDGKATKGTQSIVGLSRLVRDLEQRHVTTSTIGVGLLYGEDLLAALAVEGNGNHYFVEDPQALADTLKGELACVRQVVASAATVRFVLPPGVQFVQGFDRTFQTDTHPETRVSTVTVSLGDLHAGAEATVLMELSLTPALTPAPSPTSLLDLAQVSLTYAAPNAPAPIEHVGMLRARKTSDPQTLSAALDTEVAARVEQALIVRDIERANAEIRLGNYQQAQTIIRQSSKRSALNNALYQNEQLDQSIRSLDTIDRNLSLPQSQTDSGAQRLTKDNAEIGARLKK